MVNVHFVNFNKKIFVASKLHMDIARKKIRTESCLIESQVPLSQSPHLTILHAAVYYHTRVEWGAGLEKSKRDKEVLT